MSALDDICRRVNEYVDTKQPGALPVAVATTRRLLRTFDEVDNVLNLFRDDPASYLVHHRGLALKRRSLDAKTSKNSSRRVAARTGRDWNTADDIKRQLEEKGVILKDRAGATDWVLLESADVNSSEEFMQPFELVSPHSPNGDQPEAIRQLVQGLDAGTRAQVLLGVTGSGKTFTMANVITETQRPTLVLAQQDTRCSALR